MYNRISLVRRWGPLLVATLLCFLILTFSSARFAPAAMASGNTSIVLGFKQNYGSPPKQHLGIDVAYAPGANLYAPVAGTISFIGRVPGSAGLNVTAVTIEQPDGSLVTLNPFATTAVSKGSIVRKGQVLGALSAVGDPSSPVSHAHLSLRVAGVYRDPSALIVPALDASQMLPAAQAPPSSAAVTVPPASAAAPVAASAPAPAPAAQVHAQAAPAPASATAPVAAPGPAPAAAADASAQAAGAGDGAATALDPALSFATELVAADGPAALDVPGVAPLLAHALAVSGGALAVAPQATTLAQAATAAFALLARQSLAVRICALIAAGLLASGLVGGLYQAGRRLPSLARRTAACVGAVATSTARSLQYALRDVTMVSRSSLLRTKPSSFGATRPKEVI